MTVAGFRQLIIILIDRCHQFFFGSPASQEIIRFVQNLSIFALATFVSAPLLFAVNIISGRMLGPHDYGLLQLALSWATPLSLIATGGVHLAVLRFLPRSLATNERRSTYHIIASSLVIVSVLTIMLVLLSFLLENQLIRYLGNSVAFYRLSVMLAVALAFWSLINAIILSTAIKLRALLEVVSATIIIVMSTLGLLWLYKSGLAPLVGFIAAYLIVTIWGLIANRSLVRITMFRKSTAQLLLTYSVFASVGVLANFFMNGTDKLILGRFHGSGQVGLYSAYLASASFMVSTSWQIISTVLAPTINRFQERIGALKKINQLIIASLVPMIVLNVIILRLIFQSFGPAYEFNLLLAVLFGTFAIILVVSQVYNLILSAEGVKGVKKMAVFSLGYAIMNVILLVLVIPPFGIVGAIVCQLLTVSALAISLAYQSQKIILKTV